MVAEGDSPGFGARRIGEGHSSELIADAAVSFLEDHSKSDRKQPFFCYVSFTAPHDPRDAPPQFLEPYQLDPPPLPDNFLPQYPWCYDLPTLTLRDEVLAAWPRTSETVRQQLAEYYGIITHLDAQVGRILEAGSRAAH
jgi:arylsulfatase A-like enzyme